MAGRPKKVINKGGRPTKMTADTVNKLEQGFKIGLNDTECCAYVGISRETFYNFLEKNTDFRDKIHDWKQNPVAKAKNTIFKNLDDPQTAKWYLERKCKDEFSTKQEVEVSSSELVKQGLNKINEYFTDNKK